MHSPAFLHPFAAAGVTWMDQLASNSTTGTRRFGDGWKGGVAILFGTEWVWKGKTDKFERICNYFRILFGWNLELGTCFVMMMQDFCNKNV
jgi:hypothetical protein